MNQSKPPGSLTPIVMRSALGGTRLRAHRSARLVLGMFALLASSAFAQSRSERAEAYLTAYHDLGKFNGVALVVDRGEVLFEGALGFATLEPEEPLQTSTRFRIASLTKQFTAALILRLQEEGRLQVDRPVGEYIEEYPAPNAERITLHHLLTHTSGLPSYTKLPNFLEERATAPLSPGDIVALTWAEPLAFEPGSQFEYSNSGYVLLGWVAERVTGLSYEDALTRYVLEPLGLEDTGYDHWTDPPSGHAGGYTRRLVDVEPARPIDTSLPYSAGMLYSTVGDLARWTGGLLGWEGSGPFRDPATLERMLTPELAGYAYGIGVGTQPIGRDENVRVVKHTGGIFGFASVIQAFPDHHRLIILLDNTSSDLGPIVQGLTNLLWGVEAELPRASIAARILPIVESAGIEAALARYRNWKRTRPDQYEYGPGQLMRLAEHYREADPTISIAILEALAEEEPEMPVTRLALAELYTEQGEPDRALEHLETALTFHPGTPQLLQQIVSLGAEPDPPLRLPVVPVEPETLEPLVGEYRIDPASTLTVEMEEGRLMARRTGEPAFQLLPQSPTLFLLHGSHIQLAFDVGEGAAPAVSILESGRRVTFPRIR